MSQNAALSVNFPYGEVDCYGIPRDRYGHAKLRPYERPDSAAYRGDDALVWAEVRGGLGYRVFGLDIPSPFPLVDDKERPTDYIITSPNIDFIPKIDNISERVWVRTNGRFYFHDFALYPQWFFPGTSHLPYVRRHPGEENLHSHEYRLIWLDITREHFQLEEGSLADVGRLKKPLVEQFRKLRIELSDKINKLVATNKHTAEDLRNLKYSQTGMLLASVALDCAAQTFFMTVVTTTSFQRHFLEALACYDYLTKWQPMQHDAFEDSKPVDSSIMGAITPSRDVAIEFCRMGVPVWLVRPPSAIPPDMNVGSETWAKFKFPGMVSEAAPNVCMVYCGPASSVRNRACQFLRAGNIALGHTHSANILQAGDASQMALKYGESAFRPPNPAPAASSSTAVIPPASWLSQSVATNPLPTANPVQPVSLVSESSSSPPVTMALAKFRVNPNISFNFKKSDLSGSPLTTTALPVWKRALAAVEMDWKRLWDHENMKLMRGYPVPDPYLFTKPSPEALNRANRMLVAWLFVRSAWLNFTTSREDNTTMIPDSQHWREFLTKIYKNSGLSEPHSENLPAPSTSTQPRAAKKQKVARRQQKREAIGDLFDFGAQTNGSPVDVHWNGSRVLEASRLSPTDCQLPTRIVKEVVWDLFENNWRLELLALDRCVVSRSLLSREEASERDLKVAKALPGNNFIMNLLPRSDNGLGAIDWKDRMEYVEGFRVLLSGWSGPIAQQLAGMSAGKRDGTSFYSEAHWIARVEEVAYPFYCQTFFDYFARLPTIPLPLPR